MYKEHLKELIEQVLKEYVLYSESAVNLLLGTAAQESKFGYYLKQLGKGPARGIFQMERPTFDWLKSKYGARFNLHEIKFEELVYNLKYAVLFARLRYYVDPYALPDADDIHGLGMYWKRVYNTSFGKGTVDEFVRNYKKYVR